MRMTRWVVVVLALLVVAASAGRISLRAAPSELDAGNLPAEWRSAFTMLAAVVEDDDFQDSLREFLRSSPSTSRVNYCRITCVVCDDNFQIVALNLTNVHGSIAWQSIPKGTTAITVRNSILKENFDLTTLPYWVKVLRMNNVTFMPGPAKFRKRHSMLQIFECVRCNLRNLQWATVPSLTHLDLSQNPLQPFDFAALPPTLRFLNMSQCNASMEAVTLQSLPPPLTVLDVSDNRIKGPVTSVVFPTSLEVLRIAGNQIDGELLLDNFPFTLIECDISRNQIHGSVGDMSTFLSIQLFKAHHNVLTSILLDKLPTQLEVLDVSFNQMRGSLDVSVLPSTLVLFDVSHNQFSGSIGAASLPPGLAYLDLSFNALSGKLDLTKFSDSMRFVYVQYNQFDGEPDLTNLPVNLRRILIHDNNWDSLMPPLYL